MNVYDLNQSFEYNVTYGPFWEGEVPARPPVKKPMQFLGQQLNSPFGIAACPLTVNSRFISLMSQLGYDLLTYKSVRSVEWHGNVFPHWQYADVAQPLQSFPHQETVKASFDASTATEISMVNSFGIQSVKPEYWQADVAEVLTKLQAGQLFILSLMCTPQSGETLVKDATRLAQLANETSVKIFEINLACPNTDGGQGLIYEDLQHSLKLCAAMKNVLGDKPLLVKVGYYQNQTALKQFMTDAQGLIAGIASTNTYNTKVENAQGEEAFPGRPMAGLSGNAVRQLSLQQAQNAVTFKQELGLKNFEVIGIGGVTQPEHVNEYLDLGVSAVQTAVGAFADPLLAFKFHQQTMKGTS